MVVSLAIAFGIVAVSVYVLVRHGDRGAAGALVLLAAAAFGVSFLGARERDRLEHDLVASQDTIAQLEAAPAQRGFSSDARSRLVQSLSEFVGPTAFVLANSSDRETSEYAREIGSVLNDAGWEVPPSFGMMYRPVLQPGQETVPPGVILGVSDEVPDAFGLSVYDAFRKAGVDITRGAHWPGTEHPVSILVGPSR